MLALLDDPSWIERRVEYLVPKTPEVARRRFTLDLDVRRLREIARTSGWRRGRRGGVVYVPVAVLRRELLTYFDLSDADGRRLVLPPRQTEIRASVGVMAACASDGGKPLTPEAMAALNQFFGHFPDTAMLEEDWTAGLAALSPWLTSHWSSTSGGRRFGRLWKLLLHNFLLLVPVHLSGPDLIIRKFSFDAPLMRPVRTAAALGFRAVEVVWEVPLGESRSWQLTVESPPGLELVGLQMAAVVERGQDEPPHQSASRAVRNWLLPHVGRFYVRESQRQLHAIKAYFQADAMDVLQSGVLPVVLLSALLAGVANVADHLRGIAAEQGDAVAALLLVVPTVVVVYVFRHGDPPLLRLLLRPVRWIVGVMAVATYAVTAVILVAAGSSRVVSPDMLVNVALVTAWLGGLFAVVVSLGWLLIQRRARRTAPVHGSSVYSVALVESAEAWMGDEDPEAGTE